MKKIENNLVINILTQSIVFFINLLISFFFTPFVTRSLGIEAYGFMALSTQLINILNLFVIALNSMAGRFISIAIHQNDELRANKYFTSIVISNWIYVFIVLVPSAIFIYFLEYFISIPPNLIFDIKILHSILFLNYFFGLVFSTYSISTFVVNKIYLTSLRSLESNILRILLLFLFYYFLPPFAFYIVLVAFIVNLYTIFFNIYYKKKFLPDLVFNTKFFDLKSIIEVSKSGFWNVLVRLGQLLIDGFDLFISNWFLGPLLMGVIALSKTIPTTILSLVGFVGYAFVPDLTYLYAHSKITEFKNEIKKSIKIMGFIINIPLALLFLFGKEFYFLWLATSESETIYILTSITLIPLIFSGSLNSLYNVFTITNKLMINAVSVIFSGLLGFIISILLLSFTDLGIYSIVIASSLVSTLRILLITIPFGAKFLGLKWNTFYSDLIKSITFLLTALFIGFFVRIFIIPSDWYRLALSVSLTTIISMFFNFFVFLSKTERHSIERIFLNKKGL